jgi:hypothetical protein
MKSESEINKRLDKLYARGTTEYVRLRCGKLPHNCVFNQEHTDQSHDVHGVNFDNFSDRFDLVPNVRNLTLVNDPKSTKIRLCLYGSENPGEWNGDICDDESVSRKCGKFISITEEQEAKNEFYSVLLDDQYVKKNLPEIAALQWVTGRRYSQVSNKEHRILALIFAVVSFLTFWRKFGNTR